MAKISDFSAGNPFPESEYVEIDKVLGKKILIIDAEPFTNAKGAGVHILATMDGKEIRMCTHGIALTETLSRDDVQQVLKAGDAIECKMVKSASKTDPTKSVIRLEDARAQTGEGRDPSPFSDIMDVMAMDSKDIKVVGVQIELSPGYWVPVGAGTSLRIVTDTRSGFGGGIISMDRIVEIALREMMA